MNIFLLLGQALRVLFSITFLPVFFGEVFGILSVSLLLPKVSVLVFEACLCLPSLPLAARISLEGLPSDELVGGLVQIRPLSAEGPLPVHGFWHLNTYGIFRVGIEVDVMKYLGGMKLKNNPEMSWKEALDLKGAIAFDKPPHLMYAMRDCLGGLHLRRGDPPEACKALALAKRPDSFFIQSLMN